MLYKMFSISLHPEGEYISDYIRKKKYWEAEITEVLTEVIKDLQSDTTGMDGPSEKNNDVVVYDIGANIGWFSLISGLLGAKCVSFEPIKANCKLLKESIILNNYQELVEAHQVAIGNRNGIVQLNTCKKNMGLCSERTLLDSEITGTESCTIQTLDSFIDGRVFKKRSVVVKIDVKQTELNVLRGMTNFLKSGAIVYIIIELNIYEKEVFDILRKHGYIYVLNIGFTSENRMEINFHSKHLTNSKLFNTIDSIETEFKSRQNDENPQMNVLISNVPF